MAVPEFGITDKDVGLFAITTFTKPAQESIEKYIVEISTSQLLVGCTQKQHQVFTYYVNGGDLIDGLQIVDVTHVSSLKNHYHYPGYTELITVLENQSLLHT